METLQQFVASCIGYQWELYTIKFIRKNGNRRRPWLTCAGIDSIPKDMLPRRVAQSAHVEPFVYEFWLEDD